MKKATLLALFGAVFFLTALSPVFAGNRNNSKPPAAPEEIRDKWAVVVGINNFQDPAVGVLNVGVKNALEITRVLKSPLAGKFAGDHVVSLLGARATTAGIEDAICNVWLTKKALPSDLIVLYFSTRMIGSEYGDHIFLASYDTRASDPVLTAVDLGQLLIDLKRRTQCPNIVCILDTSPAYDQAGKKLMTADELCKWSGVTIFSATERFGTSFGITPEHTSLFTSFLMDAFKVNGGESPLLAVAQYVTLCVEKQVKQVDVNEQIPVLAMAPGNEQIADRALGRQSVVSRSKRNISMGYPISALSGAGPRIAVSRNVSSSIASPSPYSRLIAQALPPANASEDKDNDEAGGVSGSVDFGAYMTKMKKDIQAKWQPPKGFEDRRVAAVFTILQNGTIVDPQIVEASGSDVVDKSALEALHAASPLDPLPAGAPKSMQVKYKFQWNVNRK